LPICLRAGLNNHETTRGVAVLAVVAAAVMAGAASGGEPVTATAAAQASAKVTRIKLYDTTPNVVAGSDSESDPTEPTLDLYLPATDKATGARVPILPGGGYFMLTLPGEGPAPAAFFLSYNIAAFVLRSARAAVLLSHNRFDPFQCVFLNPHNFKRCYYKNIIMVTL
jgi:hypothetical protein